MEHHGDPANLRLVLDQARSVAIPVEVFQERVEDYVGPIQQVPIGILGGRAFVEEGAWEAVGFDDEPPLPTTVPALGGVQSAPLTYALALTAWRRRAIATHALWVSLDGDVAGPVEDSAYAGTPQSVSETPLSSAEPVDWRVGWVLNAILGPPPGVGRRPLSRRSRAFVRVP